MSHLVHMQTLPFSIHRKVAVGEKQGSQVKLVIGILLIFVGLLAVGGTDGLVKVFALKVLPSISGVAQYVLWGDKDDMQVQWLDWLHLPQV